MPSTTPPATSPGHLATVGELNAEVLRLTRAVHAMRSHLAAAVPGAVPWATFVLLFHLVTGGPQRASALADSVFADPSTVSRQVDQLVKLGLVERRADPVDGRATLLAATDDGVRVQRAMRDSRNRMTARFMADWSTEDVAALTGLLGRFNDDMAGAMPQLVDELATRSADITTRVTARTAPDTEDLS